MSACGRGFHDFRFMSFLLKNEELLEKYNEIWDKVSNIIKEGFDSESVTTKNIQELK